ncbi:MAG TPA: hypothetical protein VK590_09635 [Saprospiraceae bacterium]|nr:hypothetical protein [Saprospiraceae bacterium]
MKLLSISLIILVMASCTPTLTPFTNRLYEKYNWKDDELKRIQFYLSSDIVLRRDFDKASGTEFDKGSIKIVDGKKIEQVVIPHGTPGVFMFKPNEKKFAISFESGNDQKYLMFGPNPKRGGEFVLLASDWEGKNGIVTYDGKEYVTDASAAWANLLVDLKKSRNLIVENRTVKGRTLGN